MSDDPTLTTDDLPTLRRLHAYYEAMRQRAVRENKILHRIAAAAARTSIAVLIEDLETCGGRVGP